MSDRRISRRDFVKTASAGAVVAGLGLGASTTSGMVYRRLGRTGLMVSELGLGCSPHGQRHKYRDYCEAMPKVIHRALELGVNVIDTSPNYRTQPMIGRATQSIRRDTFILCTKSEKLRGKDIIAELERGLRELQTDYVDVLHEHAHYNTVHQAHGHLEFVEACGRLKEQGKIRFFGAAGHNPDVLAEYARSGHFDTVMVPFNYLSRGPERELFPLAHKLDLGIFGIKPLTGHYRVWDLPTGSNKRLDALVRKYQAEDYVQAGLKFVLSNPRISCAFCGMERIFEVEANTAMAGRHMTRRDGDVMESYAALAGNVYCRMCDRCMPCPRGVAIPDIQRFHMYYDNYGHTDRARELYAQLPPLQRADRCADCGECERRCPNGIAIREKLRAAHRALA